MVQQTFSSWSQAWTVAMHRLNDLSPCILDQLVSQLILILLFTTIPFLTPYSEFAKECFDVLHG